MRYQIVIDPDSTELKAELYLGKAINIWHGVRVEPEQTVAFLTSGNLSTEVHCTAPNLKTAIQVAFRQHEEIEPIRQEVRSSESYLPHLFPYILDDKVIRPPQLRPQSELGNRRLMLDLTS